MRTLLVAVVAVGAIAGYWTQVLAPKRKEADELSTKIAEQQAQLAQSQSLLANYQKAKESYRQNYTTLVRLGKAVPADDDVRSLLVQLDTAAKRSGVGFENIDIGQGGGDSSLPTTSTSSSTSTTPAPPGAVAAGAFSAMPFSFSFGGDFDSLSSFFSRLERFVTVRGDKVSVDGRLLRIESISLQPSDDGWPSIRAQIGASSYIVPLAQDPGAAGSGSTTTGGTSTSTAATGSSSSSTGTSSSTATTTQDSAQ
jgi:Pilus assembly protein, PilO